MKTAISLLTLLISLQAFAEDIKFGNIEGWKVTSITAGSLEYMLFSGADQVLSVTDSIAEEKPAVRLHNFGPYAPFDQSKAHLWNDVIFKDKSKIRSFQGRVVRVGSQYRYIAEFLTDMGTPNLLPTIVMGFTQGDKLYILIYDQHRENYVKSIKKVKELLLNISIS